MVKFIKYFKGREGIAIKTYIKILIGLCLFLFIGAGTIFMYIKSTIPDEMVADPEIEEIIESEYVLEIPEISVEKTKESSVVVDASTDDDTHDYNEEMEQESTNVKEKTVTEKSIPVVQTLTVEDIKGKYVPAFESLESQANSKINSLIDKAISEYTTKKQAGEDISYGYLYNKYVSAANELETKTDTAFSSVLTAFQTELKTNGFSSELAEEFEQQYENTKEARKSALMKKAMEKAF